MPIAKGEEQRRCHQGGKLWVEFRGDTYGYTFFTIQCFLRGASFGLGFSCSAIAPSGWFPTHDQWMAVRSSVCLFCVSAVFLLLLLFGSLEASSAAKTRC